MKISKRTLLLFFTFFISIVLRLQNFFLLPIDAHAMRQTDTESVIYYFATVDPNPLHPMASLIRPQTNSAGYFFLEFPAYQYIVSIFYRLFGTHLIVIRLFNLALFSLSFYLVYKVTQRIFTTAVATWSTVFFSLIPSSIFFFGHAVHPDLFCITMVLLSMYLLTSPKRTAQLTFGAAACFSIAVGTRPFILMALPSLCIVLWYQKAKSWEYVTMLFGSLFVYGLWTLWQKQFPEADHSWQYWTLGGREALYTLAGWKHLLWRNTSGEVIGRVVSALFCVGILSLALRAQQKHAAKIFFFCFPWLAAIPLYWWVAPAGNAAHQYYANVFVLPILFVSAFGTNTVITLLKSSQVRSFFAAFVFLAVLYNGYRTSSYFYHDITRQDLLTIAQEIEQHVPKGEKIVYLATNSSIPFSLAHRQGWMLGGSPTDVSASADAVLNMKKYGAKYAVYAPENYDLSDSELQKLKMLSNSSNTFNSITIFRL